MKISFDKKADALYIRFSESKYFESEELKEGFILDFDKKGKVVGLELLDVSRNLPKESLEKISFKVLEKQPVHA